MHFKSDVLNFNLLKTSYTNSRSIRSFFHTLSILCVNLATAFLKIILLFLNFALRVMVKNKTENRAPNFRSLRTVGCPKCRNH